LDNWDGAVYCFKIVTFSASTVFVCNGSGFEPYQDSYNKTRLAHEKHHIQDNLGSDTKWWRINLFLFKIIEYGVSWLRKLSEIPTGH